jgi:hypothetical protein
MWLVAGYKQELEVERGNDILVLELDSGLATAD